MRSAAELRLLSELLDRALDLPETERESWLAGLQGEAARLAPTLRELLARAASGETDDLLARGPVFTIAEAEAAEAEAAASEQGFVAGATVGPYRLVRELGRGGMGEVWLAERVDGQLRREVALKLPMTGPRRSGLIERFARERDILAGLVHPHIARLYDAGVADDGQPYMALEVVVGESLTGYCDRHRLGLARRLALFMQVLDAVQYAHTRLVIHRDLKPGNILVGDDGRVHLLDFGVAKLLADADGSSGDGAAAPPTQLGARAYTPDYASPEQVSGAALGTPSDVYALGVVLYELLCGRRPYALRFTSRAQLEQAIVAAEPAALAGHIDAELAARRGTTPRELRRALRGDLEAIVGRALRKRPEDRYGSAAALADDLRRHLDGEPVAARRAGPWYRAGKFVRRHRWGVASAAAVIAALAGGLGVALWQVEVAQRQTVRASALRDFMTDLFKANSDAQPDPERARRTTARELLDIGAHRIEGNFARDPEGKADALDLLAEMYFDLGLDSEAADFYHRRVETLRQAFGSDDDRVARALVAYAKQLQEMDRDAEQSRALDEAQAVLDRHGDTTSEVRAALLAVRSRAEQGDKARARAYAEQAVQIYRRYHPGGAELPGLLIEQGISRSRSGDPLGAEATLAEALDLLGRDPRASVSGMLTAWLMLADAQMQQLHFDAAERSYRRVLALTLERNGPRHEDTLHVLARWGWFLHYTSRRSEARPVLEQAWQLLHAGSYTPNAIWAVNTYYGQALTAEGRVAAARPVVDGMVARDRAVAGGVNTMLITSLRAQAELAMLEHRWADADRAMDESWALLQRPGLGASAWIADNVTLARARLQLAERRAPDALATLQWRRERAAPASGDYPVADLRARALRAAAEAQLGRLADARADAQAAVSGMAALPARERFQSAEAEAQSVLGGVLREQAGCAAALPALQRAAALLAAQDDASSPRLAEAVGAVDACRGRAASR
ncbi:MAG: protein kinase [Burkholderiales bacterium]|nr:protein kinase [Burkholderiales bacterium]